MYIYIYGSVKQFNRTIITYYYPSNAVPAIFLKPFKITPGYALKNLHYMTLPGVHRICIDYQVATVAQ